MNAIRTILQVVYWLGLCMWLAALVSAGIAAMNVFPTADATPLTLDGWPELAGIEHERVFAGQIMDGVFFTADAIQFICVPLVVLTMGGRWFMDRPVERRRTLVIASAAIVIAAVFFAYYAVDVAPRMNDELRAFWTDAKTGDAAAAVGHRDAFNELHPTADAILRINMLLVLVGIAASAAVQSRPARPHGARSLS